MSVSIGIADTTDAALETSEDLIEAADRALYEAKRDGKGRAVKAHAGILGR